MSSEPPLSPPKPLPWSDQALEHLCKTLRATAQQYGFSPRQRDRYEAWILAFLSWCAEHVSTEATPPKVDPSHIGAFQKALRTRTDTTEAEVYEAMDALSFLFGAVARADESLTVLPNGIVFGPRQKSGRASEASTAPNALRTLQLGWQKGTIASVSEATTGSSPDRLEKPPEEGASDSNADDGEPQTAPASTAKAHLRRYQTQLESLHASDSSADPKTA
jgi:hypothetical protein